jgi:hypothetical protein
MVECSGRLSHASVRIDERHVPPDALHDEPLRMRAPAAVSADVHLVIVAPRLCALPPATLRASPALARLAALATHRRDEAGIDAALVDTLGVAGARAAATMARGAGIDTRDAHWLVADPVTLVAGIDDVTLAGRVGDLDATAVAGIVARLDAHFAADGLAFVAAHRERWFVRMREPAQMTTRPTDTAIGASLYANRPRGPDARRFERFANEMQMLLHAAPENAGREAIGLAPCNGVWLWDVAPAADSGDGARVAAFAAAGSAGDLARGMAMATGGEVRMLDVAAMRESLVAARVAGAPAATHIVIALAPPTPATFGDVDAGVLAPAVGALRAARVASLTLVADGDATHRWHATPPRAWQRVAAAWRRVPFVVAGE